MPGANHDATCYDTLGAALTQTGHRVVALDLPSDVPLDDERPAVESTGPDIEAVVKATQDQLDQGEDVIVVAHSYGGMVMGPAVGRMMTEQQEKKNEAESGKGRILWLVYMASIAPLEGQTTRECRAASFEATGID